MEDGTEVCAPGQDMYVDSSPTPYQFPGVVGRGVPVIGT